MRLRPHHLLCTLAFEGKGYSDIFAQNMTSIVKKLNSRRGLSVNLIFSSDDICTKCPNLLQSGACADNDKVMSMDRKVMELMHLEEKSYKYGFLLDMVKHSITAESLNSICSSCTWFPYDICAGKILKKCKP